MKLGIAWQGPEFAGTAVGEGADAFCSGDFADHEAYVSLAEMAICTQDVLIGTAIAYAFARTPFSHAAAIRQLHKRAGERIFVGLGTGAYSVNRDWLGVPADRPAARLGECIDLIRAFLRAENGDRITFAGRYYKADAEIVAPVLGTLEVPLLVGAFNAGMVRMAGRKADGVVGHSLFTRRWWNDVVRPQYAAAAQDAGRTENGAECGWVIVAVNDEDPARATLDARRMVAFYLTVATYEPFVEAHGWIDEVRRIREAFHARDVAAMAAAVTDEMLDEIAIHGSTEQARHIWDGRCGDALPRDVAFLAPPSYLVSERRRREYARAALLALGRRGRGR